MSLEVFPELQGLTFGTEMTPNFSTGIATSANGKEIRTSYQPYPLWDFDLSYEWLPNRLRGKQDLERIVGFFLQRLGSFEAFLFDGPETPLEEMTLLGVTDGTAGTYPLLKTTGGFIEPAGGVIKQTDVQVFLDGMMVSYDAFTLNDHRDIAFDVAPESGKQVRATYKPLYRVRFKEDSTQFSQFTTRLWELQTLSLRSVFA